MKVEATISGKICPQCRSPHRKRGIHCSAACYRARPVSAETRARMSKASLGKPKTALHAARISAGQKKISGWRSAAMKGERNFNWANKAQGTPVARARFLAAIRTRRRPSGDVFRRHSEKMKGPSNKMRGRTHSLASRIAVSATKRRLTLSTWDGFSAPEGARERQSKRFVAWRLSVFERDRYTCADCGRVGGALHAHHIKTFARHPSLRYDVDNGITLCGSPCHTRLRRKEELHEARFVEVVEARKASSQ